MQISEDEAWQIYHSISCANMEQGVEDSEHPILKRIRAEFPNIDKELKRKEHHDHLWSVVVEADPRVISVRKKINVISPHSDNHKIRDKLSKELFKLKGEVMAEIQEREAKQGCNHSIPCEECKPEYPEDCPEFKGA